MSNFFYMKKPPLKLVQLAAKLPKRSYALILILDGRVENPEFVAYHREGNNDKCWNYCLAKWKKTVYPTLERSNVQYWEYNCGQLSPIKL
jgi:hypothetical protein